ncbi:MAG: ATP-binding protein [Lachnospiraceae bacterium]|nr:ATP-binding protein [Lachnospiraceae bacterium]
MIYNVDFAISGLVFLIILFIYLGIQHKDNSRTKKCLTTLIFYLILADFFDIVTCITISYAKNIPLWLNYVLNIVFFEFNVMCMAVLPKYIDAIIAEYSPRRSIGNTINNIILIIYAVICATTPFTGFIFYFDNYIYTHGIIYYTAYLVPLYFLFFSLARLLVNKKAFNKRQFNSLILFIIFAIAGPAAQMLLNNGYVFDFLAFSIAAFISVIGYETPDVIKMSETLEMLEETKKHLETEKSKEENRSRALQEMTKSASWSIHLNPDGTVSDSFWSDEFISLLGYEPDEVNTDSLWMDSLHPDDKNYAFEAFLKGFQGSDKYDVLYRLRSKSGEYKWYRGTGELTRAADNSSVFQGIIQDINEEVVNEQLVKERLATLEELEKSQLALREAVQKAESADRAKSTFLANMSHEIRTPINAVLGMNELIGRESTEKNIQEYSANVADAGHALLSIINDILDFSKIETGRMELAPSDYSLSDLIREIKNIIMPRYIDKGLEFIIENNPDIPDCLYGDEVRIRQILLNILTNSLKYTDKGSVRLKIDFEKADDNNILLIFKAIDTGIGIKPENLPKLFEAFKRVDMDNNRKREGTGLGLSITKSFIELMNGSIDVESEYQKGSCFTIRIPQLVKADKRIGLIGSSSAAPAKKKSYMPSFTAPDASILVVDDVAMNLQVVKGLLRPTKIHIDTVSSGLACLEAIEKTRYDLILLDHMMPEPDGIEVKKMMTENKNHLNLTTPVIMLTANAITGAREEYMDLGFADYLSKPFMPAELEAVLKHCLPSEKLIENPGL